MPISSRGLNRIARRYPFVKREIATFYRSVRPAPNRVMSMNGSELVGSSEVLEAALSTFDADDAAPSEILVDQRQEVILFAVGWDDLPLAHLTSANSIIGSVLQGCDYDTVAHLCVVCRRSLELIVSTDRTAWFWELDFLVLVQPMKGFPRHLFR